MNGNYIPIFKVFTANLPRILSIAGLTPPQPSTEDQKLPYSTSIFPDPLLQEIVQTLTAMTPRPSLQACSTLLLSATKFNLLAATNGGLASTRGLFDRSLPSESSEWGYFSCDTAQVAKPAPEVYENIWKKLEAISFEKGETEFKREGWFIASHTW